MPRVTSADQVNLVAGHIPGALDGCKRILCVGERPHPTCARAFLRDMGHDLTILEIWEPYCEGLREQGYKVIQGDVRDLPPDLGRFDIVWWWMGPEHLEQDEIAGALAGIEVIADLVIIGCPWGKHEQGEIDGNRHQIHRTIIYPEDVRDWGYQVARHGMPDTRIDGFLIGWRDTTICWPNVIACIIVYQEEKMLPGCLQSITGRVGRIVIVDGAYAKFPHVEPWSTDRTLAIARAYGAEIIECPEDENGYPCAWENQRIKRSAYFVGSEGDWYFHIDADERLLGRLPEPEEGKHYAFQIVARAGNSGWVPRLFQHRGHMRYEGSHNAVWSDDRLVHMKGAIKIPPGECRFLHLAHYRGVERQRQKGAYYAWQKPAERPYRKSHGI